MKPNVNQVDKKSPPTSAPLSLLQLLERGYAWFEDGLIRAAERRGDHRLGKADLRLLANLNCGTTYSSELARRLGVSRQAVGKLLKNLVAEGLVCLETDPGQRNTKQIVITPEGEKWIAEAVGELQWLERTLTERLDQKKISILREILEADWGEVPRKG